MRLSVRNSAASNIAVVQTLLMAIQPTFDLSARGALEKIGRVIMFVQKLSKLASCLSILTVLSM